jgi:regulator of protease activity HflC (stomatin/prohibitin superfamily)
MPIIVIGFIVFLILWNSVKIVPQQQAWVVETLGKFDKVLEPGLVFLMPFIQKVAYKHSLKEAVIDIEQQMAITSDNVSLRIDGVLYIRVVDAKAASYGVSNYVMAVSQLAQTTMRAVIGRMHFEKTFEDRDTINTNIVNVINEASTSWGVQCMRYEIKDMIPPHEIQQAMELQAKAERHKRAQILESEGTRQSKINIAEADKQEQILRAEGTKETTVLQSEASKIDQINRAGGEAEAIRQVAIATAESIRVLAIAISEKGGTEAMNVKLSEQYFSAFSNMAKNSNTVVIPANLSDAAGMITAASTLLGSINKN